MISKLQYLQGNLCQLSMFTGNLQSPKELEAYTLKIYGSEQRQKFQRSTPNPSNRGAYRQCTLSQASEPLSGSHKKVGLWERPFGTKMSGPWLCWQPSKDLRCLRKCQRQDGVCLVACVRTHEIKRLCGLQVICIRSWLRYEQ